jgi:hypothetical protein
MDRKHVTVLQIDAPDNRNATCDKEIIGEAKSRAGIRTLDMLDIVTER